jgi:hypothetical protein
LAFTPFYPQMPPKADVRELAEPVPGPTTEAFQRFARERVSSSSFFSASRRAHV